MFRAGLSILFVLLCDRMVAVTRGEAAVFFPPMELRTVSMEQSPFALASTSHGMSSPMAFQNQLQSHTHGKRPDSPVHHSEQSSVFEPFNKPHIEQQNKNPTFNSDVEDMLTALGVSGHRLDQEPDARAAGSSENRHVYGYPPYPSYGHSRPHDYWEPPYEHEDSYDYEPPPPPYYPHHSYHPYAPPPKPVIQKPLFPKPLLPKPLLPALPTLPKPDLSSKLPILLSLGQRLLGLPVTGALSPTLTSVLTPILGAGANLKSVIGKLLVPIIVLVLVNVEVLALTWWLWEDCSKSAPAPALAPIKPGPRPDNSYYYRSLQYPPQKSPPPITFYR